MSETEAQKRPIDIAGCKTHLLYGGKSKISLGGKYDSNTTHHILISQIKPVRIEVCCWDIRVFYYLFLYSNRHFQLANRA